MQLSKDIIQQLDKPGPRYTSYPTAPEWQDSFGEQDYLKQLQAFGQTDKTLSLYVHIPFCQKLCYFCACTMLIRRQNDHVGDEYLEHLFQEMDLVAQAVGTKKLIKQYHWGGGTPTYLNNDQIKHLFDKSQTLFDIDLNSEVALEIDPRTIDYDKLKTLKACGFNRISMGIQDFDEQVQEAINRVQPLDQIKEVVGWVRDLGFDSMNFDLIYGLPKQTQHSFAQTVKDVIDLKPDRIALYSYAYLPWMKKHQTKVDESQLPNSDEKLDIFIDSRESLLGNGYQSIAMDHFALKTDEMAHAYNKGRLYRNFMGYTVKPADEYIGLGMSSIGFVEGAFVQNKKILKDYYADLKNGHLPVARGKLLSLDDHIRQWVIWSLMCHFKLDKGEFQNKFNRIFDDYFFEEKEHIAQCVQDDLLAISGDNIEVTDLGKLFIRNICMGFDWYLRQKQGHKQFSKTI